MKNKVKYEILPIFIALVTVAASFYFHANFPETVPGHWNFKGEVDRWVSKEFGAFFLPVLLIVMYGMFLFLPKIDPKKEKYVQFLKSYKILQNVFLIFFAGLYFIISLAALGYNIEVGKAIPILIGILFVIIGNYMGKIRSNWFVGIKTPWTLSSENVWNKTNRLGGRLFVIGGIIMAATAFIPKPSIIYVFTLNIIMVVVVPIVYSYFALKNETKSK